MKRAPIVVLFFAALGMGTGLPSSARAAAFYVDVQGGTSQFWGSETLFGSSSTASTSYGAAVNAGIFRAFGFRGPLDLHLGLQYRFESVSQGTASFSTHMPYLVARAQFLMFYVSAGVAPYFFRDSSIQGGGIRPAIGSIGLLGEFGALWAVTPKFSLGAAFTTQFPLTSGTLSPAPMIDLTAVMRFYFGFSGGGEAAAANSEYNGWRYIGK